MNYTLKIVEIRKETEDAITLCFKQPGLKKVKYLAGQYLTLIFRINGRRYVRPYSFSSCPSVDEFLEITVKRVPMGIVSNHINDVVKVGDVVEVMPPMGDFIYHPNPKIDSVYLWGAGSGITPLISLAKHILHMEPSVHVNLIFGNRNYESVICADQIGALAEKFSVNFVVKHFHTKLSVHKSNAFVVEGRISHPEVLKIIEGEKNLENSLHYICGPVGLKTSVKEALVDSSVLLENIFVEDFELIRDPKEYDDILSQSIQLDFNGDEIMLEVTKGRSILEAALDADIELPYSCQTGNCSSCLGELLSGDIRMIGLSKPRNDLGKTKILLCCSHPLSDNVHVKI